jgi:acetolactate synthase-1/3 small subunit
VHKLVDVLKVTDITDGAHIEREVMLVKARCAGASRDEVMRMAEIYRGQIVDVTPELYTVQLVGSSDKLDAFLNTLAQVTDIVEVVRSGVCGIARGDRSLHA